MRPPGHRRLRARGQAGRHRHRRTSEGRRLIASLLLLSSLTLPVLGATTEACDRAAWYILQGRYGAALQQLEGARSGGSSSADNENLRGLALMMNGEPAKAAEAFGRALELDAGLVEARFNRAVAMLKLGELKKAATEFERISEGALAASASYHRALALDRLGDLAGAEAALDRTLAIDPSFAPALLHRGLLHERGGKLEVAVREYLAYLKLHPQSAAAMLRVGVVAQRAGRNDVGIAWLRKVIATSPDSPEAVEARKFLVMWE
ncbi:MAG TPA: tetratricopeptide repeat protein [Thermoanaerobaculia bacterium]|nr:tetratricopeptide repeat protein [Thermoanaerobaculia bacterium]